jgi:hypothetical protein
VWALVEGATGTAVLRENCGLFCAGKLKSSVLTQGTRGIIKVETS